MSRKRLTGIYLRGIAMGAADVVPGVSGGTVAFITGIYEELLNSIKSINLSAIKTLIADGPMASWQQINGNFLLVLGLGILTSILSLAKVLGFLLDQYPLLLWSFFFGLILASSFHMAKQINRWSVKEWLALIVGVLIAVAIAELKPADLPPTPIMVFVAGSIAICAMILPGISGSFILVLMGMYRHILEAVNRFDWLLLLCFAAGCGVGLLSFTHLLSWLLTRFHNVAMSLLTGFLFGSLYLVWPWKHTLSFYENRHGEQLALEQQNVLPAAYQSATGLDSQLVFCTALMLAGIALVLVLERFGDQEA
jgi:putative membrane protein